MYFIMIRDILFILVWSCISKSYVSSWDSHKHVFYEIAKVIETFEN